MQIIKETEEMIFFEERISLDHLRITANGRYLWNYEGDIEKYHVKFRVSFMILTEEQDVLRTDHMEIKRLNEKEAGFTAIIRKEDFIFCELHCDRCKYKEKIKGLDFQVKVDKATENNCS